MNERKCQHITKTPIYAKSIGGMAIDRSEWENEEGAFLRYEEKPCHYITDEGEKFCPRHIWERQIAASVEAYAFPDNPPAKSSTCVWNIDGTGNGKGSRRGG
jgi:hypothetical protein